MTRLPVRLRQWAAQSQSRHLWNDPTCRSERSWMLLGHKLVFIAQWACSFFVTAPLRKLDGSADRLLQRPVFMLQMSLCGGMNWDPGTLGPPEVWPVGTLKFCFGPVRVLGFDPAAQMSDLFLLEGLYLFFCSCTCQILSLPLTLHLPSNIFIVFLFFYSIPYTKFHLGW